MSSRRGPPPLPSALKKLRGTEKSSRKNTNEPKPKIGDPGMPSTIASSKDAKDCWKSVVARLVKLKVVSEVDGPALEGMCVAFARAREADRVLKQAKSLFILDEWRKPRAHPAVAISKSSWAEFRKYAQEFGITPSSRSRVNASSDLEDDSDTEGMIFGDTDKVAGHIGSRR